MPRIPVGVERPAEASPEDCACLRAAVRVVDVILPSGCDKNARRRDDLRVERGMESWVAVEALFLRTEFLETVGRAQRTALVARYLRDRDLQREINEGLNVVESRNRANSVIFFGKGGDIATNRRDEQELSVLCLRVLQAALVYVNTLMVQDVLTDEEWAAALTDADRRGLTPLFWTHVAPYGEVKLDMTSRLALRELPTP
jgi:hypothetical protein